MVFITTYKPTKGEGEYGSFVVAGSILQAELLIKKRGLNERVVGVTDEPPFDESKIRTWNTVKKMHLCCFLLSMKSTSSSVFNDLNDDGLLHEYIHSLEQAGDYSPCIKKLDNQLIALYKGLFIQK